jgi:methionyl-tRNA formyltransferase
MSSSIVFMGSPDFALPSLKKISMNYETVGVFTQPDKPSGRGKAVAPSPVKKLSISLGLKVFQPSSFKDKAVIETITNLKPDLIIVVAYGKILPPNVLDIPPLGCINVHASLLPRWRGAAPIQAAILHGDPITGVTVMKMGVNLDDGPILARESIPIKASDTAGNLTQILAELGANLLISILPDYIRGKLKPILQDEIQATFAPKIDKSQGELDFRLPAEKLCNQIRAFSPWPGSFFCHKDQVIRIFKAQAMSSTVLKEGELGRIEDFPAIGTFRGDLKILELQTPGRKRMAGSEFLRGFKGWN